MRSCDRTRARRRGRRQAYERGDWERAAEVLRGSCEDQGATTSELLRIYARALARLERDEAAARSFKTGWTPADWNPRIVPAWG